MKAKSNFTEVVGIDVSKEKIDVHIHNVNRHKIFNNKRQSFEQMVAWVSTLVTCSKNDLIFAFENTGLYSLPLWLYLQEHKMNFIIIPGLEIKRSLGIKRGKDDKIDAKDIALYTYRRKDEIKPNKISSTKILELKKYLSLREKLVKQRAGYLATIKEHKKFESELPGFDLQEYVNVSMEMVEKLNQEIKKIEKLLDLYVKSDEEIKKSYELITSIKGVGRQTALFIIAYTHGFILFDNWRKFASYAGIAPFPHQSGSSIKGKTKVSNLGYKKIKALLSSCASTAIMHNKEMKSYYNQRLSDGKNKMSTLNAVRNKLLSRIFAVVNRGTPYVDFYTAA